MRFPITVSSDSWFGSSGGQTASQRVQKGEGAKQAIIFWAQRFAGNLIAKFLIADFLIADEGGFPAGSLGFPSIFAWSFEGILAMGTHVKLGSPWVPLLSRRFSRPSFNASLQLGDV